VSDIDLMGGRPVQRIAGLLQAEIANRTSLTVGSAVATVYQQQTGLFLTAAGKTISAVATNFCYGSCLLAKVEGVWYAVNPSDTSQVVSSRIDRFEQRRVKFQELSTLSIAIKPSTPISVRRGSTGFAVRISIDGQQAIATKFKIEINPETTAADIDYSISGDIQNLAIPAGKSFVDIIISVPFMISDGNRSLILNLVRSQIDDVGYEIETDSLELTIEPGHFGYRIHKGVGQGADITWNIEAVNADVLYTPSALEAYENQWNTITQSLIINNSIHIYVKDYPPNGGYIGLRGFILAQGGVYEINPLYMPRTFISYNFNLFQVVTFGLGAVVKNVYREDFIVLE
jgi:hypothetical protein